MQDHGIAECINHIITVQPPRYPNCQAFPAIFIDQVQHAYGSSIMCPGTDKIARPDMVAMLWTQPNTRSIMEPQSPSWLLFLWNLQPLATPDTFDSILTHLPTSALQQRGDPTIPVASVLAG